MSRCRSTDCFAASAAAARPRTSLAGLSIWQTVRLPRARAQSVRTSLVLRSHGANESRVGAFQELGQPGQPVALGVAARGGVALGMDGRRCDDHVCGAVDEAQVDDVVAQRELPEASARSECEHRVVGCTLVQRLAAEGFGGQVDAQQFGQRGEDIAVRDQAVDALRALTGNTQQKWHSLGDVCNGGVALQSGCQPLAVICGEHDQRVVVDTCFLQGAQHPCELLVDVVDRIAVAVL